LQAGAWYHIAVTNSASSVTLYLNGLAVASGSMSIDTPQNTQFYIGRIAGPLGDGRQLDGLIDEPQVFNRALTAEEIEAVYNGQRRAGRERDGPGAAARPAAC
jgi:hypothetical protein